jgi:hypothetical protein
LPWKRQACVSVFSWAPAMRTIFIIHWFTYRNGKSKFLREKRKEAAWEDCNQLGMKITMYRIP